MVSSLQCLLSGASQALSPEGTFFDIGGGNGCVAQAIQDAGWVVLVELGHAGAQNAAEVASLSLARTVPHRVPARKHWQFPGRTSS